MQKSLLEEYRNFHTKHGGHPKIMFERKSNNSRQKTHEKKVGKFLTTVVNWNCN
jgi:hypothetical protein